MKLVLVLLLFSPILLLTESKVEWLGNTEYDFGDIPHGEPVVHHFQFKNISGEDLIIDNVRASCGCTSPVWSYEPITSDSISEIKIIYDAKDDGYFFKKLKVYFHGQRKPEKLYLEGFVKK